MVGPSEGVLVPDGTRVDHEVELAVIIRTAGKKHSKSRRTQPCCGLLHRARHDRPRRSRIAASGNRATRSPFSDHGW